MSLQKGDLIQVVGSSGIPIDGTFGIIVKIYFAQIPADPFLPDSEKKLTEVCDLLMNDTIYNRVDLKWVKPLVEFK
jgi:heptaprenylglyceryl phosphate synthase|tara:strand:+ start:282 stop:509 length:228 start_codon:yes stop_codon:yes gene_type:complete